MRRKSDDEINNLFNESDDPNIEDGADVVIVTKLRIGDANTMMAEGGIQAADKENDSPAIHFVDAFGGGHYAAKRELLKKLV